MKAIAILNIVAWSGFWAFGYLALTGGAENGSTMIAMILAFVGALIGIWAYMKLVRHSEASGYSKGRNVKRPQGAGSVNEEEAA